MLAPLGGVAAIPAIICTPTVGVDGNNVESTCGADCSDVIPQENAVIEEACAMARGTCAEELDGFVKVVGEAFGAGFYEDEHGTIHTGTSKVEFWAQCGSTRVAECSVSWASAEDQSTKHCDSGFQEIAEGEYNCYHSVVESTYVRQEGAECIDPPLVGDL